MRVSRLMLVLAICVSMVMVATSFSGVFIKGESPVHEGKNSAREGEDQKTISLYFNENADSGKMITTPGSGGTVRGTHWTFTTDALGKDLTVEFLGKKLDVYNLQMAAVQSATVTVKFYDDSALLGERSQTFTSAVSDWSVNLNIANSSYTFDSGSVIKFEISASGNVFLTTSALSRIDLRCIPVTLDVSTNNYLNVPADKFHPNWPNSMTIINFEGHAYDAFGAGDIKNITIEIVNSGNTVIESKTNVFRNGDRFNYTWNYSRADKALLLSGQYKATFSAKDTQGNYYNISKQFIMVTYGLMFDFDDDLVYKTSSSSNARVSIRVLNSGYYATTIELGVISLLNGTGWSGVFEPATTGSIAPGESAQVTFVVNSSEMVDVGEMIVIDIKAVAGSDTDAIKATTVGKVTVQKVLDTAFSLSSPAILEKYVEYGLGVTYEFALSNMGTNNITLKVDYSICPYWTVTIEGLTVEDGNYYVTLAPNEVLNLVLKVTAPSLTPPDSAKVAEISVTVTSVIDTTISKTFTTRTTSTPGLQFDIIPPESVTLNGTAGLAGVTYPTASYSFTLKNTGSSVNSFKITTDASCAPGAVVKVAALSKGIKATPKTIEVRDLNSGESVTITVEVTPAMSASANLNPGYPIKVNCSLLPENQRFVERVVYLKLNAAYNLSMSLDSDEIATPSMNIAEPRAEFVFNVRNLGNEVTQVVFTIATGIPTGWIAKIDNSSKQSITFELEPGRGREITVTIIPSLDAKHGTSQVFEVTATSATIECTPLQITVNIEKDQNMRVWESLRDNVLFIVMAIVLMLISIALIVKRHW